MKNVPIGTIFALSAFCLCGCAHYEYELVEPATLARHVGPTTQAIVKDDPLVYRMETVEDHLLIWIQNPTTDAILLVGEKSAIVDPSGQSHGLGSRTIAANSYIRLILPPPAWVYAEAPNGSEPVYLDAGVRVRVGSGRGFHRGFYGFRRGFYGAEFGYGDYPYGWYDAYDDYPPEVPNPDFFPWRAGAEVRVSLTFERAGKQFQHSFVFERQRVR